MLRPGSFSALLPLALAAALAGCSEGPKSTKPEDFNTIALTLPNGKTIRCEQMITQSDMLRGMMFREQLPPTRGLLFYHPRSGHYPYWMYQVRVPLDMIWLDHSKRIVQIIHDVPPCTGPKESCKSYGGAFEASFVLELAAGQAAANGLKPGMQLEF